MGMGQKHGFFFFFPKKRSAYKIPPFLKEKKNLYLGFFTVLKAIFGLPQCEVLGIIV